MNEIKTLNYPAGNFIRLIESIAVQELPSQKKIIHTKCKKG
tara:strand:+ start:287 stop:409 length:123 start_codon:yes stop_codon:yes gene_type:complete